MGAKCTPTESFELEILGLVVLMAVVGWVIFILVYGNKMMDVYGTTTIFISAFVIAYAGVWVLIFLGQLTDFTNMDPNKILTECFYKDTLLDDTEKLEKAYSVATTTAYNLFIWFLVSWVILGTSVGVLGYIGPPHWLTTVSIYVFSLMSFISFILMVVSYLRYRDYSKKLLVVQLKKSGKAEISIKI